MDMDEDLSFELRKEIIEESEALAKKLVPLTHNHTKAAAMFVGLNIYLNLCYEMDASIEDICRTCIRTYKLIKESRDADDEEEDECMETERILEETYHRIYMKDANNE